MSNGDPDCSLSFGLYTIIKRGTWLHNCDAIPDCIFCTIRRLSNSLPLKMIHATVVISNLASFIHILLLHIPP